MDVDEFRRNAHQLVDWMADYLAGIEAYPVRSQAGPGEVTGRLPSTAPEKGESFDRVFADFQDIIMPGMTHWQHPNFHAYFPANSSPPSVLAEMLTSTVAAQCMIWQTSPAATELETRVMDWLKEMLDLPKSWHGVIQDTASTATLCAILSARERALDFQGNQTGLNQAGHFRVYCSEETHSSIDKAVRIAGLGQQSLRKIPVDDSFAMVPTALRAAIEADRAAGITPLCVVATLGTTGASGFDPVPAIGDVCRAFGIWLHIDAAWAGTAMLVPEQRWLNAGLERADSFVFNPHKWMFTNFDCTAYFVADEAALVRTFEILPEYLKTREGDQVINYRDWGIQLGRRFRALKLWFVIRSYGVEGLRDKIRGHIALTRELANWIAAAPDFELQVAPKLALLCFRYHPIGTDDPVELERLNSELLEGLNDDGQVFLTHTKIRGDYTIRFCIGQTTTEKRHIEKAWQLIQDRARRL